ncbi:unnamed protein product [Ambrosiozyma monospora]|uniref:Unnamed protein product n=1 Tax=Ambrosiozyma monospora TaxID=43982 RepID=A0A9W7DJ84_AMBMO|nr:unnamed protein product [Ambrosiozyma monospora]
MDTTSTVTTRSQFPSGLTWFIKRETVTYTATSFSIADTEDIDGSVITSVNTRVVTQEVTIEVTAAIENAYSTSIDSNMKGISSATSTSFFSLDTESLTSPSTVSASEDSNSGSGADSNVTYSGDRSSGLTGSPSNSNGDSSGSGNSNLNGNSSGAPSNSNAPSYGSRNSNSNSNSNSSGSSGSPFQSGGDSHGTFNSSSASESGATSGSDSDPGYSEFPYDCSFLDGMINDMVFAFSLYDNECVSAGSSSSITSTTRSVERITSDDHYNAYEKREHNPENVSGKGNSASRLNIPWFVYSVLLACVLFCLIPF